MSVSAINNCIGLIYWDQVIDNKALEFYQKSLKIKERLGDGKGLSIVYNNVSLVYKQVRCDGNKALEYYLKSLDVAETINYKVGMTLEAAYTARIFTELGNIIMTNPKFITMRL